MADLGEDLGPRALPKDIPLPPFHGTYYEWKLQQETLVNRVLSEATFKMLLFGFWVFIAIQLCIPTQESSLIYILYAGISFVCAVIGTDSDVKSKWCLLPILALLSYESIRFTIYFANSIGVEVYELPIATISNGWAFLIQWKESSFVPFFYALVLIVFLFHTFLTVILIVLYHEREEYQKQKDLRTLIERHNFANWMESELRTRITTNNPNLSPEEVEKEVLLCTVGLRWRKGKCPLHD